MNTIATSSHRSAIGAGGLGLLLLLALCSGTPAWAEEPTAYELIPGSTLTDGCDNCERPLVEYPISGTFVLQFESSVPGATKYDVLDVSFSDESGGYTVKGSGTYTRLSANPMIQRMELEVEINGTGGIALAGESAAEAEWPLVEIEITEQKVRDPNHIYTFKVIAVPRPVSWEPYELLDGSDFLDECLCPRPPIQVPVEGTFRLGKPLPGADMVMTYVVRDLDVRSSPPAMEYRITGGGIYRQGGDVAMIQDGRLVVTVNSARGFALATEPESPRAPWPKIEIELTYDDGFTIYKLHMIAQPVSDLAVKFKRGDANADRTLNIADAVYALGYLFGKGTDPTCLDALDANDDGDVNIADPILVLAHLFAKVSQLPPPFAACGPDLTADDLACERFAPCE